MSQPLLPTYLPDVTGDMLARVLTQDSSKPVLCAVYSATGAVFQTVEDYLFGLIVGTNFPTATGADLDRWGQIANQRRNGMVDQEYRRAIAARILANRCEGSADEYVAILMILTGSTQVWAQTVEGGLYMLQFQTPAISGAMLRAIRRVLSDTRLLGCEAEVEWSLPGGLVLAAEPGDLVQVPAGYESRLDCGIFGSELPL